MGDIYGRCFRCLVWIDQDPYLDLDSGNEMDWDHGAAEDIREFFHSFNVDAEEEWQSLIGVEMRRTSSTGSPHSPVARRRSHVRDNLLWFLEHPWFKRVWVYQEFVLAP